MKRRIIYSTLLLYPQHIPKFYLFYMKIPYRSKACAWVMHVRLSTGLVPLVPSWPLISQSLPCAEDPMSGAHVLGLLRLLHARPGSPAGNFAPLALPALLWSFHRWLLLRYFVNVLRILLSFLVLCCYQTLHDKVQVGQWKKLVCSLKIQEERCLPGHDQRL